MFRRKMTEQELRMWCIEKTIHNGLPSLRAAGIIYDYITEEREESQKKPRECFFSRLCSQIRDWLK